MRPRLNGEKRKYSARRYEAINGVIYRARTRANGTIKLKPVDKLKDTKNEALHARTDTPSSSNSTRTI